MLDGGKKLPFLRIAYRVHRRFGELSGGYLASAVTLAAFLSLFPLLLVGIAVLGFFSHGDPGLAGRAIDLLGLSQSSDAADFVHGAIAKAEATRSAATIVGVAGLLWSGLGLVAALQHAYDSVWQVTGRGLTDRAIALGWLAGAALLFVASFAVTAAIGVLPALVAPLSFTVGLGLSFTLFLWTARVLPNTDVGWRPLVPGAAVGAVGLEVLKVVGGIYVPRAVAASSAMYGSIGVVFAILAWLLIFGRLIVYSAVVNVVRWEEEHGSEIIGIRVPSLTGPEAQ